MSITTRLVLPMLLLVLALGAVLTHVAWATSTGIKDNMLDRYAKELRHRIDESIRDLLHEAPQVIVQCSDLIDKGVMIPGKTQGWECFMRSFIESHPGTQNLYYADANGAHHGVRMQEEGDFVMFEKGAYPEQDMRYYRMESTGKGEFLHEMPYHPDQRPWYKHAIGQENIVWNPVIVSAAGRGLTLVASKEIRDDAGNHRGVVAASFTLKGVSEYLSSLDLEEGGMVFIVDDEGYLLASSEKTPLYLEDENGYHRIKAEKSLSKVVANAVLQMPIQGMEAISRLRIDDQDMYCSSWSLDEFFGARWQVMTIIPEKEILGEVNESLAKSLVYCLGALLIAILLGLGTSGFILKPIRKLTNAFVALSNGQRTDDLDTGRHDELGEMSWAFESMASQVQDMIQNLEDKVESRTKDIKSYAEMTAISSDLLMLVNDKGQVMLGNRASIEYFGLRKPAFSKEEVKYLFGESVWGRIRKNLDLAYGDKCESRLDIESTASDGTKRWLDLLFRPFQNGEETWVLIACRDMSEMKRNEEQLKLARMEADKANHAKGMFLASVSHEIRTPMNGMMGMLEVLKDSDLNDSQQDCLRTAINSSETLLAIINDILDFSKIDSGKFALECSAFSLRNSVEHLCSLHGATSKKK